MTDEKEKPTNADVRQSASDEAYPPLWLLSKEDVERRRRTALALAQAVLDGLKGKRERS